jgi:DNA polymerase IV
MSNVVLRPDRVESVDASFCRDCCSDIPARAERCSSCGSPRVLCHPELHALAIAHVDCDAFYAAVEKRDNPSLLDKPVIVGGGSRGVVLTACYIARSFGVKSAMPMFTARRLCPQAVVVPPSMEKYASVARDVRRLLTKLTPLVEPISIDEAFVDLGGTHRLHGSSPAKALARFAGEIDRSLGITVSIGLSCNKFLAKIASDLDKPRGFAVLGAGEASSFLAPRPVTVIFGVGAVAQQRLARGGFRTIGDLQRAGEGDLARRYGTEGRRLARLAHGLDDRAVTPHRPCKSVSAETTFERDLAEFRALELHLWRLCERVSARLKQNRIAGSTVTLKLKTAAFHIRTRTQSLTQMTQLAGRIFATGRDLLITETDGTMFRLIGIGVSALCETDGTDISDWIDRRSALAERAMDRLRAKYGHQAIVKGLAFEDSGESVEERASPAGLGVPDLE